MRQIPPVPGGSRSATLVVGLGRLQSTQGWAKDKEFFRLDHSLVKMEDLTLGTPKGCRV